MSRLQGKKGNFLKDMYGNVDIVFDHFSRIFKLCAPPPTRAVRHTLLSSTIYTISAGTGIGRARGGA